MTWPPQATRAEVLRILEMNRNNFHHWVISREETAVLIGLLRDGADDSFCDEHELGWAGKGCPVCVIGERGEEIARLRRSLGWAEKVMKGLWHSPVCDVFTDVMAQCNCGLSVMLEKLAAAGGRRE